MKLDDIIKEIDRGRQTVAYRDKDNYGILVANAKGYFIKLKYGLLDGNLIPLTGKPGEQRALYGRPSNYSIVPPHNTEVCYTQLTSVGLATLDSVGEENLYFTLKDGEKIFCKVG